MKSRSKPRPLAVRADGYRDVEEFARGKFDFTCTMSKTRFSLGIIHRDGPWRFPKRPLMR
jgi:hypothetical protein